MPYTLPDLPYDKKALAPYISEETLEYHYGKHHRTYVTNLNTAIVGTKFEKTLPEEGQTEGQQKWLEDTIINAAGEHPKIFNNAAQVWNHTFYWNCLKQNGGSAPSEASNKELYQGIQAKWGGFDDFKKAFKEAALSNFGSGWTWLVKKPDGSLEIVNTSNAATPLTTENKPLLTCDVWEHAYYIDRRNDRGQYFENFWQIVDWDAVNRKAR